MLQYRRRDPAGTLMRHALAAPGAVGPLPVRVIGPPVGARLAPASCHTELLAPRQAAALVRAVPVPAIARAADLELRAAARTTALPKLVHPTPRAGEVSTVSTGGLARIIVPGETKRSTHGAARRQPGRPSHPLAATTLDAFRLPGQFPAARSRATPRSP